jgi:hypothetical protein
MNAERLLKLADHLEDESLNDLVLGKLTDWDAAKKFFDVNHSEAIYLFDGGHVRTPKQEAKVIRQFVERKRLEEQKKEIEKQLEKLPKVESYVCWD